MEFFEFDECWWLMVPGLAFAPTKLACQLNPDSGHDITQMVIILGLKSNISNDYSHKIRNVCVHHQIVVMACRTMSSLLKKMHPLKKLTGTEDPLCRV